MFEKEAKKWMKENTLIEHSVSFGDIHTEPSAEKGFVAGAEFGYNLAKEEMDYLNQHWGNGKDKTNEWHYVKDKLPKKQYDKVSVTIAYLNAFKNPCKRDCFYDGKDFVYWDSGKNVGWKKAGRFGKIYAWKYADDFFPEPPKEIE